MKKIAYTILFTLIIFFFSGPVNAYDFNANSGLNDTAGAYGAGYTTTAVTNSTIFAKIGSYIQIILSFIGVLFLILMIYGGYVWMMARGDEQSVTKAQGIIKNSIIGIIIVLMAYAITMTIKTYLIT